MQGFVCRWSNADDAGNVRECPSGAVFPFVGSEPTNAATVALLAGKYPNGLNAGGGALPQCPPFAGAVRVQFDENGGFAVSMQVV